MKYKNNNTVIPRRYNNNNNNRNNSGNLNGMSDIELFFLVLTAVITSVFIHLL